MTSSPALISHEPADDEDDGTPVCVMSFQASDATGAGGLAADISAIAASGGHCLPVVTGVFVRDTTNIFDFIEIDSDAVQEQARTVLEDMDVDVFRIGFMGSPEALAVAAEIMSDYEEIPVVTQVCPLSWWERDKIDAYLDALAELVLPQTSVLVGNIDTLWRWLLPEWSSTKSPSPRDIAAAAAQHGVPYVVITGVTQNVQSLNTVVANAQAVLATITTDRYEANFMGAGDTFAAALATLLASGDELIDAVQEASIFVNRSLMAAFQPGMGAALPDRMFWAQMEEADEDSGDASGDDPLSLPASDTRH